MTGASFDAQRSAFAGSRAPNLPGHCEAGACESIACFADAIVALLDRTRPQRVVLCGNSMGGAVALELALRADPRIAGVVLLGSGARLRVAPAILDGLVRDFEATIEMLAGLLYAHPTPLRTAAAIDSMRAVGPAQTLSDFRACDAFDVTGRLAHISIPVLAIAGEADRMTPPKYAEFIAGRVARGDLRILPDCGHLAMAEAPAEVNALLADFVHSLD